VTDLSWDYGGVGFIPLETDPVIVTTGGPVFRESYPIEFKVDLDLVRDTPGDYYYGSVVLELSAP